MRDLFTAGIVLVCFIVAISECTAQEVTYCKNYETGEIIVVEKGQPCPFPTSEI